MKVMVSSCRNPGLKGKNKSTQGESIIQPTGAMWSQGFNVSYNEVGSTHQVSEAAGKAKRGASGKPAAVRGYGRLYVK